MARPKLRTLQEVLDEAVKVTGENALYDLDCALVKEFKLGTLRGTTKQLLVVIQSLRTAAIALAEPLLNHAPRDLDDLDDEQDTKHHYDA